jgi:hypothetical protein
VRRMGAGKRRQRERRLDFIDKGVATSNAGGNL